MTTAKVDTSQPQRAPEDKDAIERERLQEEIEHQAAQAGAGLRQRTREITSYNERSLVILANKLACAILRMLGHLDVLDLLGSAMPGDYSRGVDKFEQIQQSPDYQKLLGIFDAIASGCIAAYSTVETMTELELMLEPAAEAYCRLRQYLPKLPEVLRTPGRQFTERFEQLRYQPDELSQWLMEARFLAATWPDLHDIYDWLVAVRPEISGRHESRCCDLILRIESNWCQPTALRGLLDEAYCLFGDHVARLERLRQKPVVVREPKPKRPPKPGAKSRGLKSKGGKKKQQGGAK